MPVTALRPMVAQYEPAGQAVHAEEPVEAKNFPVKQLEHTVDDAAEYFPPAQMPVTVLIPVVAQYDPAGHDEHEVKEDE